MTLSRYGTANLYDFSKNKIGLLLLYFFSNSYLEMVKSIDIYIFMVALYIWRL